MPVYVSRILLIFILWLQLAPTQASLLPQVSLPSSSPEFLPVEQAFQFSGQLQGKLAIIHIKISPGYYLYKERLSFKSGEADNPVIQVNLPVGVDKYDEFEERELKVYPSDTEIELLLQSVPNNTLVLDVSFQGCAEAGLCYPPMTTTLHLQANATAAQKGSISSRQSGLPSITPPEPAESNITSRLTDLLQHQPLFGLALFLLAGIGLAFTPCVLPMVPILSRLLVGQQQASRSHILGLTLTYVLAMAVTFAAAGVLVGLFGASLNLQAKLQSPWVLGGFALLFIVLALSMFGLFQLKLPAALSERLNNSVSGLKGGHYYSAAAWGVCSSLVVSPCISPPLAGALLYISTTEDATRGGLALFALGMGMGVPLLLLGLGGSQLLPRAGAWMNQITSLFGFLMLGVAIWLLERLLPGPLILLLWGVLLICSALYLGALQRAKQGAQILRQGIGIALMIWGSTMVIGAAQGNKDPLRPLSMQSTGQPSASFPRFMDIRSPANLEKHLKEAVRLNQPVLVDIYADWCVACQAIEHNLFPRAEIAQALTGLYRIRLDITQNTPEQQQLLQHYQLFGPPAMLFFDRRGMLLPELIIQGEPEAAELLSHLHQAVQAN